MSVVSERLEPGAEQRAANALLSVSDLHVSFRQGAELVPAVSGVSFHIDKGETFALVGESGSGKSVTALSVLRLLPHNARILKGRVMLGNTDLFGLPEYAMGAIRGLRVGIIFQDPMSSLNPVMTVGRQIGEVLRLQRGLQGQAARKRALELLDNVGLPNPERHLDEYPHQLSGGMRQRVMIAIALAGEPELLIADEPTTALDVTIQAQILELLARLKRETGMALWLITHDLGIVAELADRVAVMRAGKIVEQSAREGFLEHPEHPYSRELFTAMPRLDACLARPETHHSDPLLVVEDFKVYYPIKRGIFQRTVDYVRAVDGVSLSVAQGETLALVGESGCGKTTLGKGILNLIEPTGGRIRFDGTDITGLRGEERRKRYAEMQIVFQDPYSSMNPRMIVGDIVEEGLRALHPSMSETERRERVEDLLQNVGLPREARLRYPHEFSGGQRQRICIARALAVDPKLIVCDEPTSALDVSVQAQILKLLKDLRDRRGLSYLFITHDLAVVAELADRVAVMHRGKIVEMGTTRRVLFEPTHAYTRRLLHAVPKLRLSKHREF
ncbi:ABC transporter ATP-binding protein [Methylocaldum szegediense]|uniref:Glutathione ABC transporter ATP binding subunit GsiA n=1 Tax=Methylocaldum szegediense TaxID=73780 RepID=A0ABM9HVQ9_9GAMM|nr:dipeptide ABC transporter ATP-binding protein [Methylocaldum szegediense]CAI8719197.1 glutathione ABC transporter ATP binding subunit GsiA [Methylocaldum szegediense]